MALLSVMYQLRNMTGKRSELSEGSCLFILIKEPKSNLM